MAGTLDYRSTNRLRWTLVDTVALWCLWKGTNVPKEVIYPKGTGPGGILSPVVKYGNLVYTAGMVGRHHETGEMPDDIEGQSRNTMENIKAALEAAGTSLDMVLKASCFVADLNDRPAFNEVYKTYFPSDPPVRTCVQAGSLGPGVLIEVDVVAGMPD